tara:strand:- start:1010 stop:1357 length:348 start_codon:yes stop_codon:yes gene_type:complete
MTVIVQNPQTAVFNQAEELVGRYPSADGLRNAIHAVITKSMDHQVPRWTWTIASPTVIKNVESLARNYEASRGIHIHTGERGNYGRQWKRFSRKSDKDFNNGGSACQKIYNCDRP